METKAAAMNFGLGVADARDEEEQVSISQRIKSAPTTRNWSVKLLLILAEFVVGTVENKI